MEEEIKKAILKLKQRQTSAEDAISLYTPPALPDQYRQSFEQMPQTRRIPLEYSTH